MQAKKPVLLFSTAVLLGATLLLAAAVRPAQAARPAQEVPLEFAKIYWEYNASANDLGVHVSLDGEDWTRLEIENPSGNTLFRVRGQGPYGTLGMTELFFEGAEPALDEFPLEELLALFPAGEYEMSGWTADGQRIEGEDTFTHAIPDGPDVFADVGAGDSLRIRWTEVTAPPPGFPDEPIHIVGYQVIVDPSFEVTLPAAARSVTVSPEFVQSLGPGEHLFEVLAIEESGNQTLSEGSFQL
jgi:hypothetical protein